MHAKLLNRARPLWEFYVFEGMADNEIGLYSKIHHACIDGGAGAALTNMIYDISAVPRDVPKSPTEQAPGRRARRAISPPTSSIPISSSGASRSTPARRGQGHIALPRIGKGDLGSVLFDNAMFQIESAVKFAGTCRRSSRACPTWSARAPTRIARQSCQHGVAVDSAKQDDLFGAQLCRRSISLSRAKIRQSLRRQAQRRRACAVNRRGAPLSDQPGGLPGRPLTAAVPISLREEGNADANNQVFAMICSIATNVDDPKARLEAIIAQSTKSKELSHPMRALMPQLSNLSMLGAPIVMQILALLYSRSNLSDVLPPAANSPVQCAGPAADALCGGRRTLAYLSAVDPDAWHRAQHHRAELSRLSTSALSPAPTHSACPGASATCCRKNSTRSSRPTRHRLPKSRAPLPSRARRICIDD